MRFARVLLMSVVTFSFAGMMGVAGGQNPSQVNTAIIVPKMHCKGCAQKMATELYKVPGLGQVFVNVETTTMTVRPKDGQAPSALGMWEAIERAGYQPSRLQGPSGVFTSKPKS